MRLSGKVLKYGDNVDTDVIIPARYLNTADANELAAHCMEDLDPDFARRLSPGDMVAGGTNFGCGSSREHAPLALKTAGVSCVIAASFARIFYRNAINIGLPILESPAAAAALADGDALQVDLDTGAILNKTTGEAFSAQPFPPFIQNIIQKGGLLASLNRAPAD